VNIFYSLRFETSLFFAPYDSQGHGGGIRIRLHTGSLLSQVKVTLRLTVRQSVSLGVEPHLGLMTRYLYLSDNYGLVLWGALSDERTGRQRSLSWVRVPLATIFYYLSFETSLFVDSYDSQVHGGVIRPRLHTG
jgi:hypothetical protein